MLSLGVIKSIRTTTPCLQRSISQRNKASSGLTLNFQHQQQVNSGKPSINDNSINLNRVLSTLCREFNWNSNNFGNTLFFGKFLVNFVGIQNRQYSNMSEGKKSKFEEHEVVPDVIATVPKEKLEVCFCDVRASEGNCLTPTEVQNQPELSWMAQEDAFYTVCMTDPDAPSREDPQFREWHHWLVVNVPGYKVKKGKVLSAYIGAGPPKDTGLHRYVLLVYKQKCKLEFDEPVLTDTSADGRGGFKVADFAKKYDLGEPIAGNFFRAEWDDYVPTLYEKLGIADEKDKKPAQRKSQTKK